VVDEVRRRVQQDALGRRGHKCDPLYQIRGLLRHGVEHLTPRHQAKISACLAAGDPSDDVNGAWQCYQQLRLIYHAVPAKGPRDRDQGLGQLPLLPHSRGRPAKPYPQRLEGPDPGLLRHPRRQQRRHRSDQLIIEKVAGLPTDSKTLIITGFGSCSPQTDHAATGTPQPPLDPKSPLLAVRGGPHNIVGARETLSNTESIPPSHGLICTGRSSTRWPS
jgi:hypothetical protein